MLRDNLVGLIELMLSSAGAYPLALCTALRKSSDDRPPCLENPRPEGAESTLTENVASPFHAEPRHFHVTRTRLRAGLRVSHGWGSVRTNSMLGRYSSEIRTGCANERPSGSVRVAP
jgi:hypothetical protein